MNILLAGDLTYCAKSVCAKISKSHRLILADKYIPKGNYNGHVFRAAVQEKLFGGLFRLFDPNVVVFFMRQIEPQDIGRSGSPEDLMKLLSLCMQNNINRFILVSSTEVCGTPGMDETQTVQPRSQRGMLLESAEKMCNHYGNTKEGRESLVLRLPYLYGDLGDDLLLNNLLSQAANGEPVQLPGRESQFCEFLHAEDAAALLIRMIEDVADSQRRTIHGTSAKAVRLGDVAQWIRKKFPGCIVSFSDNPDDAIAPVVGLNARQQYDWLAMHDVEQDINGFAAIALRNNKLAPFRWFKRALSLLRANRWLIEFLEIALGFGLVQLLLWATAESIQFRYVDIRLLFVVIIGSTHGVRAGVLAALMACVSNVLGYMSLDLDWRLLVYNVDNWLPYVSYLLLGVVTGHIKDKNDNAVNFVTQKMSVLEQRFAFLNDLYTHAIQVKDHYKDQLLSYQNSYGKVYDVIRRLDSLVPDVVLQEAVSVLEEVFGGSSIAIYTLSSNKHYARLTVCSRVLNGTVERTIDAMEYHEIYEKMQMDQVWINRRIREKFPMYCAPIILNNNLSSFVMAFDVPYGLQSASGANQFLVLCKLIQSALDRALTHHNATEIKKAIAGTHIMQRDPFYELVNIHHDMMKKGISGCSVLRIVNSAHDLSTLCQKVKRNIRCTDTIGQGADGNVYILLKQSQSNHEVIDRLAKLSIYCIPLEMPANNIAKHVSSSVS